MEIVHSTYGKLAKKQDKIKQKAVRLDCFRSGADYGARTRHLDLGKVALYQMS